jgi:hypothetical protein
VKLPEGAPTAFTAVNSTPVKLSYESSSKDTIECSSVAGSGTILNPKGGGAGTLSGANTLLDLQGCKYVNRPGCQVVEERIHSYNAITGTFNGLKGALVESPYLFQFNVSGCMSVGFAVSGTLNGAFNSGYSSLVFDSTSGSELKGSGAKWYFEGTIKLQTEHGLLRFKL